jgi:glycosyltransferase involved in cell wall biosynthesis
VTILIPCFNDGSPLAEAVASARAVSEPDCELVVVNDGSDDPETLRILDKLRSDGLRVVERPNGGPAAAYNTGFAAARGRYVLPLDADNRIRPDYPAIGAEVLDREPRVGAVYGDAELFGRRQGRWRQGEFYRGRMLRRNRVDSCAVIRHEAWRNCGGYDEREIGSTLEDWDLWLSLIEQGWELRHVPEVLFDYRVRAGSARLEAFDPRRRRELLRIVIARHPALYSSGPRGRSSVARMWLRWAIEAALTPLRRPIAARRLPHPAGWAAGLASLRGRLVRGRR